MAGDDPLTGSWGNDPAKHADGGGFAGAVGAQETENFPFLHGKRILSTATKRPNRFSSSFTRMTSSFEGVIDQFLINLLNAGNDGLFQAREVRPDLCRRSLDQQLRSVHQPDAVAFSPFRQDRPWKRGWSYRSGASGSGFPRIHPGDGVHTVGGFVKNKHLRFMDQDTGQSQLLLHPAGQVAPPGGRKGQKVGKAEIPFLPLLSLVHRGCRRYP